MHMGPTAVAEMGVVWWPIAGYLVRGTGRGRVRWIAQLTLSQPHKGLLISMMGHAGIRVLEEVIFFYV